MELHRFTIRVKEELEASHKTEEVAVKENDAVETVAEISCLV